MRLAVSNIAWLPDERLAAYAELARAGVSGLEIAPAMFFHAAADPFMPDPAAAAQALEEIAAFGLKVVSMQSLLFGVQGAELFGAAAARDRLRLGMERAIDLAGRFAIPNLVFGSPMQRRIPDGMTSAQSQRIAVETFRALGDRAAAQGTVISLEANAAAYGTNFLNTITEVADIVNKISHHGVKMILDLGAMKMNGATEQTASLVPDLVDMLSHVHVSEPYLAPAPASVDELVPILSALRQAGYAGAVSIEMKRPESGLAALSDRIAALVEADKLASDSLL